MFPNIKRLNLKFMKTQKHYLLVLLLLAIILLVHFPHLKNQFVDWDDYNMILQDSSIRELSFANTIQIFKDHLTFKYARIIPLTYLTYAIDYRMADYNKSLELDPDQMIALLNRGMLYFDQRNYDLAYKEFEKVLRIQPDNKPALDKKLEIEKKHRTGKP